MVAKMELRPNLFENLLLDFVPMLVHCEVATRIVVSSGWESGETGSNRDHLMVMGW